MLDVQPQEVPGGHLSVHAEASLPKQLECLQAGQRRLLRGHVQAALEGPADRQPAHLGGMLGAADVMTFQERIGAVVGVRRQGRGSRVSLELERTVLSRAFDFCQEPGQEAG